MTCSNKWKHTQIKTLKHILLIHKSTLNTKVTFFLCLFVLNSFLVCHGVQFMYVVLPLILYFFRSSCYFNRLFYKTETHRTVLNGMCMLEFINVLSLSFIYPFSEILLITQCCRILLIIPIHGQPGITLKVVAIQYD